MEESAEQSRGKAILLFLGKLVLYLLVPYSVFVVWTFAFMVPFPYDLERIADVAGSIAFSFGVTYCARRVALERDAVREISFWSSWQFAMWVLSITPPMLGAVYGYITFHPR